MIFYMRENAKTRNIHILREISVQYIQFSAHTQNRTDLMYQTCFLVNWASICTIWTIEICLMMMMVLLLMEKRQMHLNLKFRCTHVSNIWCTNLSLHYFPLLLYCFVWIHHASFRNFQNIWNIVVVLCLEILFISTCWIYLRKWWWDTNEIHHTELLSCFST